jgi:flagellar biosynthesis protein FliQ
LIAMTDPTLTPAPRPFKPRRVALVIALAIYVTWMGFLLMLYLNQRAGT